MALKSHSTRDEALAENEARINTNENILPLDTCSLFSGNNHKISNQLASIEI
jgi:hypothetical protein